MWWITSTLSLFICVSFYTLTYHDATIMGHHLNSSPAVYGILLILVAIVIRHITRRIHQDRKIRALGGYAPRIPSWAPMDIDFIVGAVRESMKHENLRFWQQLMAKYAHTSRPCTLETRPGGQRLIFTIDEENIKAILATQFGDFGKGEAFHSEWHDFLGDSEYILPFFTRQ